MDNKYDLSVHDIQVSHVPQFGRAGGVTMNTRVVFYVGDHGPFTLTYDNPKASTAQIKSDIDAQVKQLAELAGVPVPTGQ